MDLMHLVRGNLTVGQPTPWDVRDELGQLLLRRGQVVLSEKQIESLLGRNATVLAVEFEEHANRPVHSPVLTGSTLHRPHGSSLFDHWFALAAQLKTVWATLHYADFLPGIEALIKELMVLANKAPDIGIYLIVRQERIDMVDYPYAHSIHTALVTTLMGRRLDWPAFEIESVAKAALTMNISIGDLQGRMAAQDFPMLGRQEMKIRRHPHESSALLAVAGVTDPLWLQTVREHHERPDGGGYPSGIVQVSVHSQALRLADVFTAKLSRRSIRASLSPQEAERHMFAEGKSHADLMPIAMSIIREVGLYPPGDFVLLKSGEAGVVVARSPGGKTPVVAVITDAKGHPITATIRRNTADPDFHIEGSYSNKKLLAKLPPERLFGYSIAD